MSPTEEALDDALELGSLVLPAVDGLASVLDVPGMVARSSVVPHPFVNLASRVRLSAADADDALDRLHAHFAGRGAPFGVMVSGRAEPADLASRLAARGLSLLQRIDALSTRELDAPIPTSGDVVVERVGAERRAGFDDVKARSFGMSPAVATRIGDLLFGGAGRDALFHLAFVDGVAVGFSQTFLHRGVAILGGAGVVPEARGVGVFRTLLSARFAALRAMGIGAAVIQSYEDTSAPILKRLGFDKRGELRLWAWFPRA